VVPDAARPGMWRVRWPDGRLSDMTNLTRAKDAVACFMETEQRRQRRRHRSSEGRLCVKTGEMPRLVAHSCQQAGNTGSSPPRTRGRASHEAGDHADKKERPEPGHVEAHLPRRAWEAMQ
jgi:hypothetical protein